MFGAVGRLRGTGGRSRISVKGGSMMYGIGGLINAAVYGLFAYLLCRFIRDAVAAGIRKGLAEIDEYDLVTKIIAAVAEGVIRGLRQDRERQELEAEHRR